MKEDKIERISRKSFFNRIGLVGAGSILTGYYSRNKNHHMTFRRLNKLELRFKKPSEIISSDILS